MLHDPKSHKRAFATEEISDALLRGTFGAASTHVTDVMLELNRVRYLAEADPAAYQALQRWVLEGQEPDDLDMQFLDEYGYLNQDATAPISAVYAHFSANSNQQAYEHSFDAA